MSFHNCTIAGSGVDSQSYHEAKQLQKRGTPEFVMSPSALNGFACVPSRWVRGWSPPESKAKQWGNLIDCIALTPDLLESRYSVHPETYPCKPTKKDARTEKKWRFGADYTDKWKAEAEDQGKQIIHPGLLAKAKLAARRLMEPENDDDTIPRWFEACDRQVLITGEWHDEDTGLIIPVSALLDFVPRIDSEFRDCLGDFKSSATGNQIKFQRQGFEYGYHVQAAFCMDIYRAAKPDEDRNTWCFIIQENFEPFETNRAMYGAERDMGQPGFIDIGREARYGGYAGIIENYCKCVKSKRWPRYNDMDESSVQGWCVLRPEPWMAEKAVFSPRYNFDTAEPEEETESMPEEEMEVTP